MLAHAISTQRGGNMESDIFKAGIKPGAPGTQLEVKVLLCYLLSALGQPISFDQLYAALSGQGLVNYFELGHVLEKLLETGHLSQKAGAAPAMYVATALGTRTGKEFEKNLPLTVREKSLHACKLLFEQERRLSQVEITQTPREGGGFVLELAMPDEDGQLMSVRVLAPTEKDCENLKRRFLNAPLTIYKGMLALLSGDEEILGEIFTKEKPLF